MTMLKDITVLVDQGDPGIEDIVREIEEQIKLYVPPNHLKSVRALHVSGHFVAEYNMRRQMRGEMGMAFAFANLSTRTVVLASAERVAVTHEIAHLVYLDVPQYVKALVDKSFMASKLLGTGFPTRYSRKNAVEYFCECYRAKCVQQDALNSHNRVMSAVMDEIWTRL
jgi:hypothetical protein